MTEIKPEIQHGYIYIHTIWWSEDSAKIILFFIMAWADIFDNDHRHFSHYKILDISLKLTFGLETISIFIWDL